MEEEQKPAKPKRPPYELIVTIAKVVTMIGLYLLNLERRKTRRGDRI